MYDLRHCHGGFVILCQSWVSRNEELLVRRVCKRKVSPCLSRLSTSVPELL